MSNGNVHHGQDQDGIVAAGENLPEGTQQVQNTNSSGSV